MAFDSLDRDTNNAPTMTGTGQVTVFVDARQDNPQETTAVIEYGPRVGPDDLEQIQCGGRVQIVGLDAKGLPVVTSSGSLTDHGTELRSNSQGTPEAFPTTPQTQTHQRTSTARITP
jgi:hypothetical protein